LAGRGAWLAAKTAVIPSKANRKVDRGCDKDMDDARRPIENSSPDPRRYMVIAKLTATARNVPPTYRSHTMHDSCRFEVAH
jgi:hypothetical protein